MSWICMTEAGEMELRESTVAPWMTSKDDPMARKYWSGPCVVESHSIEMDIA